MKTIIYYHLLMVHDWADIFDEQLMLIEESGLYDEIDSMKICCIGADTRELEWIIKDYEKVNIEYHSANSKEYEFPALQMLYDDCLQEDICGLYLHSKGVTCPKSEGGKYWRDYMNYYNICKWDTCLNEIENEGFDACGVKLIEWDGKQHYSGNFFWFNSDYINTLQSPDSLNINDRYQAEFWIGSGNGKFSCISNEFVDYNTKGMFEPPTNYVHTLAYNLVSETEKAVKSLYELNSDFKHIIVDLGFPLEKGNFIPTNIEKAKKRNTSKLKALAREYGSDYIKVENIGVSQNWTAVYSYLNMKPNDILIGADPDERPQQKNWVEAMGLMLRSKEKVGMASLCMPHQKLSGREIKENSIRGIIPNGMSSWALIGFRGDFLKMMGGVPVPDGAKVYGWIENAVYSYLQAKRLNWCMLPDYTVIHTDYDQGSDGSSKLLREWKNLIVHGIKDWGQITFDDFLERKRNGEFDKVKLHYK